MQQSPEVFRVETTECNADRVVLKLLGELDIGAMATFELELDTLISTKPKRVVFDIADAGFICGAGFAAIGRCCYSVERVSVCSNDEFAGKILRILGHDDIVFVTRKQSRVNHHLPGLLKLV